VYVREIEGREVELGVSGRLWRDALVMYDRRTGSLWSQIDGRAILGPAEGQRLEEVPSVVTSWGEWKRMHPDTLVLRPGRFAPDGSQYASYNINPDTLGVLGTNNPDERLPGKQIVLGVTHEYLATAVPISVLRSETVVQTELGNWPVVIAIVGRDDGRAYLRRVGERQLDFDPAGQDRIRDRQTGTLWDSVTGRAVAGALGGEQLDRLETRRSYWFIWATFHPQTEIAAP